MYAAPGAFPGQDTSRLQAQAYLDLLGGVPADDRIAFAATAGQDPPEPARRTRDDRGPDDAPSGG